MRAAQIAAEHGNGLLSGFNDWPFLHIHTGQLQCVSLELREQHMLHLHTGTELGVQMYGFGTYPWEALSSLHDGRDESVDHSLKFRQRRIKHQLCRLHHQFHMEHLTQPIYSGWFHFNSLNSLAY